MSIKVCKQIEIKRTENVCRGRGELQNCHSEKVHETRDVCGEGDTFEGAKSDMQAELDELLSGKCKRYESCKVLPAQSATDEGPTFWDYFKKFVLSCNPGQEY